jgi:hypothetical protein
MLLCDHGRPADILSCEDCEKEEWMHVRKLTIFGILVLMTLIWTPAVLLLSGVFW